MVLDERGEGQVSEDIAIIHKEGFGAVQEVADIGDAPGGFEAVGGFVAKVDGYTVVAGVREGLGVGFGKVVGIDGEFARASGDGMIERGADEWPVVKGDEGFGQLRGEGAETFPKAGTQNKSLVHRADLRSPSLRRKQKFAAGNGGGPDEAPRKLPRAHD